MRDEASDGAVRGGAAELDASWLPIAHPPRPRTCVACGGISLRGFVYCGWCGKVLRDDTQIGVPQPVADVAPAVRSSALGYTADPVDFPASQQITIQHWPADASPAQEITQPSAPIRVDAPPPSDDTDPRVQLFDVKLTGMCVVVLGTGPTGMHHSATDVHALSVGDELDVMLGDGRAPTSFRVENEGLRVEEIGTTRGVARCIKSGRVGLRNGDAFRIGQTWLVYARHEGREQWGIWGRIYVLAPSGHVVTSYDVGETGLVLGTSFGDPTLAYDVYVARRHCRVVAGPTGATLEDLGGPDGTFVAVAEGELIPLGSIALFADTAVRIDTLG